MKTGTINGSSDDKSRYSNEYWNVVYADDMWNSCQLEVFKCRLPMMYISGLLVQSALHKSIWQILAYQILS